MIKRIVFILMLVAYASAAHADCSLNGKKYPEGTKVGPYVCESDKWSRY